MPANNQKRWPQRQKNVVQVIVFLWLLANSCFLAGQEDSQVRPAPVEQPLVAQPQEAIRGQAVWITVSQENLVHLRVVFIQPGRDEEANFGQDGALQLVEIEKHKRFLFTSPRSGSYVVEAFFLNNAAGGPSLKTAVAAFSIYDNVPPPPQPDVVVDQVPFPSPDGLRVLIVGEAQKRATLPKEQREIFVSDEFHKYLASIVVMEKDQDQSVPGYRIWDDDYTDAELSRTPAVWQAAYKAMQQLKSRKPDQEFWFLASGPKGGYQGPLPGSVQEVKGILSKLVP